MDEPPIPVTGYGSAADSFITVFFDTSLDTHLALDMVKKRGVYNNLAESILIKSVFDGVKKGWFVSVEASIVSKDNEIEPEEANFALVRRGREAKRGQMIFLVKTLMCQMHKFGPKSEFVVGNVQISDQNVAGIQIGVVIALAEESEAQVVHVEFSKDGSKGSIVNEIEENLHHLRVANKRLKTGKEIDDEASLRDTNTIVLEFSGMTCKRPVLYQLSTVDEQQHVVATLEISNASSMEAFDQLASRSLVKKKRKMKSSKKVDKKTAGLTPDEANAGKEIHLKEAGIDSGNVLRPSTVSLTEKDPDPPQEQHTLFFHKISMSFKNQ
ncbi:unnamed protein product [Linum trigynum]|uniref:Uncharacterized protein n=1 Tax=Linum trigynum TaxID=586398 RepID=A0AAV2E0G8_9ROSI